MVKVNKKKTKDILNDVPEDKLFWVNDGKILRNLKDLPTALVNMDDGTFSHHVNKHKNDFKKWIKDVIGDKKLARDIARTKSREILLKKLDKRINQLESFKRR